MQCSGNLGVFAIVHNGKLICGGNKFSVHSIQADRPGKITLALPLKPNFILKDCIDLIYLKIYLNTNLLK